MSSATGAAGGFLNFDEPNPKSHQGQDTTNSQDSNLEVVVAPVPIALNPYKESVVPNDIGDYLLPGGEKFGMFSDPYATMVYQKAKDGVRNGRYWLENRVTDSDFTPRELKLLELLSVVKIATRSQIERAIFPDQIGDKVILDFLKKCRSSGFLCAFSWVTPLKEDRKKPLVYGLTKSGFDAAEIALQKRLPDDWWFRPIDVTVGKGPDMQSFFYDLVSSELHSELIRIDRLISWQRRPGIRYNGSFTHHPTATFEVIKDEGEFRLFWVEVVRPSKDWVSKTKIRFQRTQTAYTSLEGYQKPVRVIVIVDGDSRIPVISQLAKVYMPDVEVRFTTDERLLKGLDQDTFILYDHTDQQLISTPVSFLQPGYEGMSASEYYSLQDMDLQDEDQFEE